MQKIPTNAALLPLGLSPRGKTFQVCKKIGMMPPQGFTLVELTVVLVIVALLLGGMMMPLAAQRDRDQTAATLRTMREAKDALGGFVLIRDRLPCPAPSALADESPQGGHCAAQSGFFPAVALGVPGNDAWGRPFRYAVAVQAWNTDNPGAKFADIPTTAGALLTLPVLLEKLRTDLGVCSARSQYAVVVFGEVLNCPAGLWIIGDKIPAVMWSDGADPTTTADDLVDWIAWPIVAGQIARLP